MTISVGHRIATFQQGGRRSRFHQLKLLQGWQAVNIADICAACHEYGFTGVLLKALDGSDWMRTFDSSPDAIGSLSDVAWLASYVRAQGLYCFCWTVPKDQGDLALQAALSAQIAQACDGLFLDVEPYNQFWGAWRSVGDAAQFMLWLRQEAPLPFVALQPDPRPNALAEIRLDEWQASVDCLAAQHYWSDFGTTSTYELLRAFELAQQTGLPILPTLPGNAGLASFDMNLVAQLPGFVLWRWGTIPQDTLAALGSAPVAGFRSSRIAPR